MIGQSTKIGAAHFEIAAKTDRFERGLRDMEDTTRRTTSRVQNDIRKTDNEIKKMTGTVGMLSSAMAAIGGVAAAGQLIRIADTFTQIRGRLALVVKEGENLIDVEERLFQLALKNRAAIEPTVALYARLRSARADLSDEQTLKIVDTWNKTLVISGASAGGAAAATIQLSQAMAGGVLRAEEFNSIVENNTRAVQLFAASLGVGMGELRAMVNEGKVSFDALVKAMTTDAGSVGDEFGKMSMTVGQAMTNLETSMIRFVGLQDQQFEGSKKLAEWINILAQNFDVLATAILVAGASVATALGVGLLQSMAGAIFTLSKSLLAAGSAAKALGMAMTFLGGPWGIALSAAAAALGSIAYSMMDLRSEAQKADDRLLDFEDTVKSNAELIKKWELAQAADDLKGVGDAAKGAADGVDELNLAMARNEKQMAIDTLTLKARIVQADAATTQRLIDYNKEVVPTRIDRGPLMDMQRGSDVVINELEAKLARQKQAVEELLATAEARRRIPIGFGDDGAKTLKIDTAPTAKAITELAGYYSDLEKFERNLADIRTAQGEGAKNAGRAAMQAMLDYLDATSDVATVLEKMQGLSGKILDPSDVSRIEFFVAAVRNAQFASVQSEISKLGLNPADIMPDVFEATPTAWDGFEQRIAEATKYGLMTAIETGDWGDAFGQILTDVTRDALSRAIDVLWKALEEINWGEAGNGISGFLGMLGGSFRPMSGGGAVSAGEMLRVGEKGSEWFVPKVDGYIVPNNAGKSLGAPMQLVVGGANVVINGNADERALEMLDQKLGAFARALPAVIDARVTDRQKRGAY